MQYKVFSIYDKLTEVFNQPFYLLTASEAIRAFKNMAEDPASQISKNKIDFNLYQVGTYDNATGEHTVKVEDLGSAALFNQGEHEDDSQKLVSV